MELGSQVFYFLNRQPMYYLCTLVNHSQKNDMVEAPISQCLKNTITQKLGIDFETHFIFDFMLYNHGILFQY